MLLLYLACLVFVDLMHVLFNDFYVSFLVFSLFFFILCHPYMFFNFLNIFLYNYRSGQAMLYMYIAFPGIYRSGQSMFTKTTSTDKTYIYTLSRKLGKWVSNADKDNKYRVVANIKTSVTPLRDSRFPTIVAGLAYRAILLRSDQALFSRTVFANRSLA